MLLYFSGVFIAFIIMCHINYKEDFYIKGITVKEVIERGLFDLILSLASWATVLFALIGSISLWRKECNDDNDNDDPIDFDYSY